MTRWEFERLSELWNAFGAFPFALREAECLWADVEYSEYVMQRLLRRGVLAREWVWGQPHYRLLPQQVRAAVRCYQREGAR